MLLRLSIYRVARGIGRALGQLQLDITFDGLRKVVSFSIGGLLQRFQQFGPKMAKCMSRGSEDPNSDTKCSRRIFP